MKTKLSILPGGFLAVTIFCLALLACTPDKNPTAFDITQRTLTLDYSYDEGKFTTVSERVGVMSSFRWTAENLNPEYIECNGLQGGVGVTYLDVKLTEQFAKDFAGHPELFPVEAEGIYVGSILFISSREESIALKVYIGAQTLSVTFYANNGTEDSFTASFTVRKGESHSYDLPAQDLFTAPDGKAFCVWDKDKNGSELYFDAEASYSLTEDTEFYAIWSGDGSNEANALLIYNLSQLENVRTHTDAGQTKYYKLMANLDTGEDSWLPIGANKEKFFRGHFDGNGHTITYGINGIDGISVGFSDNNLYLGLFGVVGKGGGSSVPGTIKNLKAKGIIDLALSAGRTADYIGGLAGVIYSGSITKVDSQVDITVVETGGGTTAYVGGIVGAIEHSVFSDVTVLGNISVMNTANMGLANVYAGGAVGYGYLYPANTWQHIHTAVNVTAKGLANTYAGGVVGWSSGVVLQKLSASGNISAETTGTTYSDNAFAGGVVGLTSSNSSASIKEVYAKGNVEAIAAGASNAYAGGIAGQNAIAMSNVYANGNATAKAKNNSEVVAFAGGIVGSSLLSLSNAYATGNVTVSTAATGQYSVGAGGIAGYAMMGAYLPKNCVALNQSVSASTATYAGRVWGSSSYSSNNNYAREDMEINTPTNSSATAKHGADVKESDWKNNSSWWTGAGNWASAWNFDTIWTMGADGYPKFQWEVE